MTTRKELEKQEEEARDLVEQLRKLSNATRSSPDFLSKVMAKADRLPFPQQGFFSRLSNRFIEDPGIRVLSFAVCLAILIIGSLNMLKTTRNREKEALTQIVQLQEELERQEGLLKDLQREQEMVQVEFYLASLRWRIWQTDRIGSFTKLFFENHIDHLSGQFHEFQHNKNHAILDEIRYDYNLMIFKALSFFQNTSPELFHDISALDQALKKFMDL